MPRGGKSEKGCPRPGVSKGRRPNRWERNQWTVGPPGDVRRCTRPKARNNLYGITCPATLQGVAAALQTGKCSTVCKAATGVCKEPPSRWKFLGPFDRKGAGLPDEQSRWCTHCSRKTSPSHSHTVDDTGTRPFSNPNRRRTTCEDRNAHPRESQRRGPPRHCKGKSIRNSSPNSRKSGGRGGDAPDVPNTPTPLHGSVFKTTMILPQVHLR